LKLKAAAIKNNKLENTPS